jgi:Flp pilus assembly protein TadG
VTFKGTGTGLLKRRIRPPALQSFKRDDKGSVAVEMGLIAVPFFTFLFAMVETALIFFASVAMEGAMEDAARMVRTGVAHEDGMTAEQFKIEICSRSPLFFDCEANLVVDVRTFDEFGDVDFVSPLDENGNLSNNFQYNIGGAGEVVMVRAFYVWDVITPAGVGLENMASGNRLLSASAVFRNEPFGNILPGGA